MTTPPSRPLDWSGVWKYYANRPRFKQGEPLRNDAILRCAQAFFSSTLLSSLALLLLPQWAALAAIAILLLPLALIAKQLRASHGLESSLFTAVCYLGGLVSVLSLEVMTHGVTL